jgi:cytochrome oxidase Cu insertion factor (SCO1/SenC/PrrC family)
MTGRLAYVTGLLGSLKAVWNGYHIQPVQKGLPDHSDFVLLIDKSGVVRVGFPANQLTPEHLAHDIGVLQRERA